MPMEVEDHRSGTSKGVKMSISTSRLSYQDCYEFMDHAMEDDKGARIIFKSRDEATFYRMRCHTARVINRTDNRRIYEIAGQAMGETGLAYRIFDGKTIEWVPKSQVEKNDDGTFTMPEWLAKEKGF